MDDDMNSRRDVTANDRNRDFHPPHRHHDFQSCNGITSIIRVDRRQRTFVSSVHGLQHVNRFRPADFADDQPIRSHSQCISDQVSVSQCPASFGVRQSTFQPNNVGMQRSQFHRVFHGNEALRQRNG